MKIRGKIDFELSINDKGEWNITYEGNGDNDIAALAISQSVLENVCSGIAAEIKDIKKTKDTKHEKHLKAILEKGKAAHFGSQLILEYMQPIYLYFKKKQDEDVVKVSEDKNNSTEALKKDSKDDLSSLK